MEEKKKVLVIEDEEIQANAYRFKLGREFEVIVASDGVKGLEYAQEKRPDIILLDLILPRFMSGMDVLRELKKSPITQDIPVIVVTNLEQQREEAIGLGAEDCLIKTSLTLEDMVAKIKQILNLKGPAE